MEFTTAYANAEGEELGQDLAGGTVEFQTDADVECATLGLGSDGDPASAFSSVSAKVCTFDDMTEDSTPTGGTPTKAVFKNSSGTEILRMTVSEPDGGGEIEINSSDGAIVSTLPFNMSSLTITLP